MGAILELVLGGAVGFRKKSLVCFPFCTRWELELTDCVTHKAAINASYS